MGPGGLIEAAHCLLAEGPLLPAGQLLDMLARYCRDGNSALPLYGGNSVLPLYPVIAARQPLTAAEWERVPDACPGLGAALPAVLARSAQEAALLVRRLPPADRQRLCTTAMCLGCAQRRPGGIPVLPTPVVWRILALCCA